MSCDFQFLCYCDEGYIVRCKQCRHYQIAFISTLITVDEANFTVFCSHVRNKAAHNYAYINRDAKIIIIPTSASDVNLLLTPNELSRLYGMLEEADNEIKMQELLGLFG